MSGLAQMLAGRGGTVSGSEETTDPALAPLLRAGVRVHSGSAPRHVGRTVELLVYAPGISSAHPERLRAARLGVPQVSGPQMLDRLMRTHHGVAVAGDQGASLTAALIGWTLTRAGFDPTVILGASAPQLGGSGRSGHGPHCVVEALACEGELSPGGSQLAVILGRPAGLPGPRSARIGALCRWAAGGGIVAGDRVEETVRTLRRVGGIELETVGLAEGLDWRACDLREERGRFRFRAFRQGRFAFEVRLRVPGARGVSCALAAAAACHRLGLSAAEVRAGLEEFTGLGRSLEGRGTYRGATLIDDSAQAPAGIAEALRTCRRMFATQRLRCVFGTSRNTPGQVSWRAYAPAFAVADEVWAVGGDQGEAMAVELARELEAVGLAARAAPRLEDAICELDRNLEPGDVLLTLGAGDVGKMADEFLRRLPRDCPGR